MHVDPPGHRMRGAAPSPGAPDEVRRDGFMLFVSCCESLGRPSCRDPGDIPGSVPSVRRI